MATMPLHFRDGHLFVELDGELWVLDTGAPSSFGSRDAVMFAGETFDVGPGFLGLDAETLSEFVRVECAGLLGADVLGRFDLILDAPAGTLTASTSDLELSRVAIPLDEFMGIPIVTGKVRGREYRFFFDTGAQISDLQDDEMRSAFPAAGTITDFYPGMGRFETDTHMVDVVLGELEVCLRCGALPGLLGMTLMMAGTQGIIGNEVLRERRAGYFPRKGMLVLGS